MGKPLEHAPESLLSGQSQGEYLKDLDFVSRLRPPVPPQKVRLTPPHTPWGWPGCGVGTAFT